LTNQCKYDIILNRVSEKGKLITMSNYIDFSSFMREAASVKPSQRQLDWFDTEFYAFIHFSPNTYTNLEWGTGTEDPRIFVPYELDCDEWVEAVKSAGMRGIIITAKHHDGFCLWQTKYTDHSVKSSPWRNGKGDVVRELSDACRRGGIKFGFYLSPWDRNSNLYGTDAYNDYYRAQLTELLNNYGEIFEVWFDGACGEGPNGKRQVYDYDSYIELIRKYQPNACIFNDFGPDVRWCGNEAGKGRHAEWSVVPSELCFRNRDVQTSGPVMSGGLPYIYNSLDNIGELDTILYSKGLVFAGSEIDMSIRPGWFYHENEEPHSLERLMNTYINSVGANACLNLNIPPMQNGRFDARDIKRLAELGTALKEEFGNPITYKADISFTDEAKSDTQQIIDIKFVEQTDINYVILREDISKGQRVSSFIIQNIDKFGNHYTIYEGTTVGHKRICKIKRTDVNYLRIYITGSRGKAELRDIEIY